MNIKTTINLYAGGQGSGCNPQKGKCGRKGIGRSAKRSDLTSSEKRYLLGVHDSIINDKRRTGGATPYGGASVYQALQNSMWMHTAVNGLINKIESALTTVKYKEPGAMRDIKESLGDAKMYMKKAEATGDQIKKVEFHEAALGSCHDALIVMGIDYDD